MSARFAGAALLGGALLFFSPSPARANGVLAPATEAAPTTLDVQIAIGGGTRWTRIQASGPSRVMWLVPARPGAAVDWAPDAWLDALDDATAPRVLPPDTSPPCGMPTATERVPTYGTIARSSAPTEVLVHTTESDVRAHAAARGYAVSTAMAARIAQIYASGGALLSVELVTSTPTSSPTLRVSDGGPALLPLALTGSQGTPTRVTAFVIGDGPGQVEGMTELDPSTLPWGQQQSGFAVLRDAVVASGSWLRESSTRRALFFGFAVPHSDSVNAAFDTYFQSTNATWGTCSSAARSLAIATTPVGRTCAPGAVGRVPGGAACTTEAGPVDPAAFACGSAIDGALALYGVAPSRATVTRLAGSIARSSFGSDLAVSPGSWELSPILTAGRYEVCPASLPPSDPPPPPDDPAPAPDPQVLVVTTESCSGDSSTSTTTEPDGTTESETTSSSGCSGDTTTTSTSSDGSSSDSSDSGGCGGDTSSSHKDSSSSSSSQDEGWDKSDSSSSSKDSCGSSSSDAGAKSAKRKTSKVSRYAMLFAFFVLPLRRRLRKLL